MKDIDVAPSVHEYLSEFISSNLRRYHQSQVTRIINPGRVILTTPHNGLLRPSQVTGNRRLNGVHNPFMELLIPLAKTRREDVVLPTIQLLRIILITGLLLLLIPLIILLVVTALITLAVKPGISAASMTRTMRAGS